MGFRRFVPNMTMAALLSFGLAACTDHGPSAPVVPLTVPSFSSHGDDPHFVFQRMQIQNAPSAGGQAALHAVAPVSGSQVYVSRADDRFLSVFVSHEAVAVDAFQDPTPAVPSSNVGAWAAGPSNLWGANDTGRLFRHSAGGWSTPTYACGNCQTLAVWGTGANAVWAGGGDRGGSGNAFIRFWDGSKWSNQSVPGNAGGIWGIWGIWGAGSSRWAVGADGTILRLNGKSWDRVAAPAAASGVTLRAVHGTGASNIWAVGDGGLVLHYNGSSWQVAATLTSAGNLYAVQAISPTLVFAAGNGLWRYDGSSWTQVSDPALADLTFRDLRYSHGVLFGATAQGDLVVGREPPPPTHELIAQTGEAGVTVTATNVVTGGWFVGCTDAAGDHTFALTPGQYIVHARNLNVCTPEDLTIWPAHLDPANVPAPTNRLGVIWSVPDASAVPLTPASYTAAVASPLQLPAGGSTTVPLTFGLGSQISCSLFDSSGNPLALGQNELVFVIMPFESESGLPPVPNPQGFPRGIGIGLALVPQECVISGLPTGLYVLETNPLQINGETVTYKSALTLQGLGGLLALLPEPPRIRTEYLYDALGDAQSNWDVGELITYGWGIVADGQTASDDFIVAAGYRSTMPHGQGVFELQIAYVDPVTGEPVTLRSRANCGGGGTFSCEASSAVSGVNVSGTLNIGADGITQGQIVWIASLPGVDSLQFVVIAQSQGGTADRAPDHGMQEAEKPTGPGANTFLIAG